MLYFQTLFLHNLKELGVLNNYQIITAASSSPPKYIGAGV